MVAFTLLSAYEEQKTANAKIKNVQEQREAQPDGA
jgi:hypothetical protein